MKINFTSPALGKDNYPDFHIALSELKKAASDKDEYVSLERLHQMIEAITNADAPFNETILNELIKGVGSKGELVIAISCVHQRVLQKYYEIDYYAISDNIPKKIMVTVYE